jgi:hypothetical protein
LILGSKHHLVCDEKHRQRLKTSRNKIINCSDVKLKILQLCNENSIKTEKKLGELSRLWRIGEGVVLLNKLLDENAGSYKCYSKYAEQPSVKIRSIFEEVLELPVGLLIIFKRNLKAFLITRNQD